MTIRSLFDPSKDIYRTIEKVITYGASQEGRLKAEISEYVVTESIEEQFRKLLDRMQLAMESGGENEVGVWVSGFYGSGKSSFTKYLGLAFDDHPLIDLAVQAIAGQKCGHVPAHQAGDLFFQQRCAAQLHRIDVGALSPGHAPQQAGHQDGQRGPSAGRFWLPGLHRGRQGGNRQTGRAGSRSDGRQVGRGLAGLDL